MVEGKPKGGKAVVLGHDRTFSQFCLLLKKEGLASRSPGLVVRRGRAASYSPLREFREQRKGQIG